MQRSDDGKYLNRQLYHIGAFVFLPSINSTATLLQKPTSMTEPKNHSIANDTESKDMEPEGAAPEDTKLNDTMPHNQAVGNVATETQTTPGTALARNSFLHLPPEIRMMIYRYVLQLPFGVPIDEPSVWRHPVVQAHTGILFTSRLIQREGISALFGGNTFAFHMQFSRLSVIPSQQFRNMIQNFTVVLDCEDREQVENFSEMVRATGDSAIIRAMFRIHLVIHPFYLPDRARVNSFFGLMRRLTNFRTVRLDFSYSTRDPPRGTAAVHCKFIRNALRSALGPATSCFTTRRRPRHHERGRLTFHPQQFLNAPSSRQIVNLAHRLDRGIRLDRNEAEANTDQNVDEPEQPPA